MVDTRNRADALFPGAQPQPRSTTPRKSRSLLEWVVVLGGSILVALLVKTFVVQAFYIPTGSMEPTLLGERRSDGTVGTGDRVIVDKVSYHLHGVNRGDVVVFADPVPSDRRSPSNVGSIEPVGM